jgi:hypothetical protein
MENTNINPFGQGGVLPDGYPISTSLDENNAQKAASASTVYQLKRMLDGSQWRGKTWYAYGTSLTDTENYPNEQFGWYAKALRDMSGMVMVNKGYAGGGIIKNRNVYDRVLDNTDGKANADIITLECMINDQYMDFGTVDDLTNETFLGSLAICIKSLVQNTNAQIVIIASPQNSRDLPQNMNGTAPAGATEVQMEPTYRFVKDGKTWAERCELVRLLCEMYGAYFVNPAYAIGYYRKPRSGSNQYYADTYHLSQLGGHVVAEYLWSKIKNIPLFYTAIPG